MKTETKKIEKTEQNEDFYYINKIKIDKDEFAQITYSVGDKKCSRETLFKGKEQVTTFFKQEFQSLNEIIKDIIPQFEEIQSDDISIKGISIKYGTDNTPKGRVVSASIQIREDLKSPLNVNTPYCQFLGDNDYILGGGYKEIVESLIKKAKSYMDGDTRTKQLKLV